MPESPVFLEFVRRPDQSRHIAQAATERDSAGPVESSKQ